MATQQVYYCQGGSLSTGATTNFTPPCIGKGQSWLLTTPINQIWPRDGTLRNFRVVLSAGPSGAATRTFTLVKNGVDTALSVSFTGTETVKTSLAIVSVVEGDALTLRHVATGPLVVATASWNFEFTASSGNGIAVYGCVANPSVSATSQAPLLGYPIWDTATPTNLVSLICAPGSVIRVRYDLTVAPGAGKSWTFTILKNAVLQDGTSGTPDTRVVISDANTTGVMTNAVTAADGDRLQVRLVPAGTPAATTACYGTVFQATTDGEFNLSGVPSGFIASGSFAPLTGFVAWSASENIIQLFGGISRVRLSNMRFWANATVGPGDFFARRNSANTALTINIPGTATTGVDASHQFNIDAGDLICFSFVGTPGFNRTVLVAAKGFNKSGGGGAGPGHGDRGNFGGGGVIIVSPGGPIMICYSPSVDGSSS